MRVADVHCATCGACIGWKFVSDLSPALENCNQASASRGRRVEGRGSGRGNGRCEERGGRQNDETYSQGGCVPAANRSHPTLLAAHRLQVGRYGVVRSSIRKDKARL